jgi:hypothetical protein
MGRSLSAVLSCRFLTGITKVAEFFFGKLYIYQFGLNFMRRRSLWRML